MPTLPSVQINSDDIDESVAAATTAAAASATGGIVFGHAQSETASAAVSSTAITTPATDSNNSPLIVEGYVIEGIDGLSDQLRRHAKAFYKTLIPIFNKRSHTFKLFNKEKYLRIMTALNRLRDGKIFARLRTEYLQIHKWIYCF